LQAKIFHEKNSVMHNFTAVGLFEKWG